MYHNLSCINPELVSIYGNVPTHKHCSSGHFHSNFNLGLIGVVELKVNEDDGERSSSSC